MILAGGLIATDGMKSLYLIESDPSGSSRWRPPRWSGRKEPRARASRNGRIGGTTQKRIPIALPNGRLLVRDHSRMMCVKVER